jgi:sugar/nucleoside kinase (ribokinase family)
MSSFLTQVRAALPDDAARASLAGRVWRPELAGPSVVAVRDGAVLDISAAFPTMRDLCEAADPAAALAAATGLAGASGGHVVITLGRDGAVLAGPDTALAVPGFSVRSVDSVGAGDAFVAALGVAVAAGATPPEGVRLACAVAATAVTRPGAQEGLPSGADVLAATGVRWPLG